jgi:hypothetical protein
MDSTTDFRNLSIFELPAWFYISTISLSIIASIFALRSKNMSPYLRKMMAIGAWTMPYIAALIVIVISVIYSKPKE